MIEDVDNAAGLDAITVAGAGGGSQKKAESVVSTGERNQSSVKKTAEYIKMYSYVYATFHAQNN